MKKILLLVLVLFLISCAAKEKQIETPKTVECASDSDCSTGGCSGQICGAKEKIKDIVTTCEYSEEYKRLRLAECRCIDNKCQWEENKEYTKYMDALKRNIS